MSLAERQMKGMAEIRSLVMKAGKKGPFSGWKVKVDYASVDGNGNPYRAERWFFIDQEGKQVYKTFESALYLSFPFIHLLSVSCGLRFTRHSYLQKKMTLINQKKNHTLNASDREQVSRLVGLSKGNYDAHFVFFKNGKTWIAIADDADRLFEVFGWQTSIVYDAMNSVP